MSCMRDGFTQGVVLDGRFECIAPLNHGSFGMVFLANDLKTGEQVAVKCILKPSVDAPYPEANGTDHLIELICHDRLGNHPHVVNLVHAFETDAHMYLVLEYCAMGDLYEAIRNGRGPLETKHVKDFMLQLIDAVEFMHSKGLYHRDIKPENIFLAQDGSMKLGDFGLSTTESWTYEACVGSDRYMAPEQFDPADNGYSPAQADIWAVGICLLNILFSRNPFVTPSEDDVLFSDFVRDRQSLFDVFPAMSQDTFEVMIHALSVDPEKRSLSAIRHAIERVISFTTDDDLFDDFCTEDPTIVQAASANRQPLRTPSLQSPPVESSGAFPWAKALHMSPAHGVRQLSAIPDNEDLFPEHSYRGVPDTPSMASMIDSALGASIQSMKLREPQPRSSRRTNQGPITGSLPVNVAKPTKAMSTVFGKDNFSKSWSDLWDEEEEEEVEDARRRFNQRNWSNEHDEDGTIRRCGLSEVKDINSRMQPLKEHDLGIFTSDSFEDVSKTNKFSKSMVNLPLPKQLPPKSSSILDKWSELGNRRRGTEPELEKPKPRRQRTSTGGPWRRGFGLKAFSGNQDNGVGKNGHTDNGGRKANRSKPNKTKHAYSGNALQNDNWRKDAHPLKDDIEWVGGWHDLHL